MDDLARLVALEEIKRLKYRYLRCLDQKDWDGLRSCLTDDAEAVYGGGAHELAGRDEIVGWLEESMEADGFHSSHHVHHPEIELVGDDCARGVWAMEDVVVQTDFDVTIRGAGFYEDRYVKRDGRWLIAHTGYKRTFEEIEPRSGSQRLTASWWSTDGRSELID